MKPLRKSDRDAITLLILIIITAVVLFPLFPHEELDKKDHTKEKQGHSETISPQGETDGVSLFYFDPNTADSTALRRLGLSGWQVKNIYKYRAHGGIYRCKEDFAQLYGLTLEKYRELEPYIRIKPAVMAADVIKRPARTYPSHEAKKNYPKPDGRSNFYSQEGTGRQHPAHRADKISRGDSVDANTADTNELKRIPGIGSYFARRIVQLRDQRQQFLSKEELLTIRNFPVEALNYITLSHHYEPIRVNTMTQEELRRHPLLNYIQARDITQLRKSTGHIRGISDMSLLPSFTPERLKAIEPYIEF